MTTLLQSLSKNYKNTANTVKKFKKIKANIAKILENYCKKN
jgi:hypothetical protein